MGDVITYVGIDAHKKDLHVAMLVGHAPTPVTWTVANEPQAIERLRAEAGTRGAGPGAVLL